MVSFKGLYTLVILQGIYTAWLFTDHMYYLHVYISRRGTHVCRHMWLSKYKHVHTYKSLIYLSLENIDIRGHMYLHTHILCMCNIYRFISSYIRADRQTPWDSFKELG